MNCKYILLVVCAALSCMGYAQKKYTGSSQVKKEAVKRSTTPSTTAVHPPMNSPIVKELKKIDYAEIDGESMLIPNCATELDEDGTVPVDEVDFIYVKDIIAKDVIAAFQLENEVNTPLKKKHYQESAEYKSNYESLMEQRKCLLDHEYFIESDFGSQFDLDSQCFKFSLNNPSVYYFRFSSNDPQCENDGSTFITTKMSEDLAYQIETSEVKTFLIVKLGENLYDRDIVLIPQRLYLASVKDGKILYEYKFSQEAPSETKPSASTSSKVVVDNAIVEMQPTYPGGEAAIFQTIAKNIVYPKIAKEQEIEGTVILRFVVEIDGSVGEIRVEKSLSPECDQAAINAVKSLQKFTPAKQNGEPVAIWFRLPIRFGLNR